MSNEHTVLRGRLPGGDRSPQLETAATSPAKPPLNRERGARDGEAARRSGVRSSVLAAAEPHSQPWDRTACLDRQRADRQAPQRGEGAAVPLSWPPGTGTADVVWGRGGRSMGRGQPCPSVGLGMRTRMSRAAAPRQAALPLEKHTGASVTKTVYYGKP